MLRYKLQNSYQDSGWENLNDEEYYTESVTIIRAQQLAKNAIAYGMVRVIDTKKNEIVVTVPAGGNYENQN
jgi:hypothetical protein